MNRQTCYESWGDYYSGLLNSGMERSVVAGAAMGHVQLLTERMRKIGACRGPFYKCFSKVELQRVAGMALGVHQQLLWGLTSSSVRGMLEGGRGG